MYNPLYLAIFVLPKKVNCGEVWVLARWFIQPSELLIFAAEIPSPVTSFGPRQWRLVTFLCFCFILFCIKPSHSRVGQTVCLTTWFVFGNLKGFVLTLWLYNPHIHMCRSEWRNSLCKRLLCCAAPDYEDCDDLHQNWELRFSVLLRCE